MHQECCLFGCAPNGDGHNRCGDGPVGCRGIDEKGFCRENELVWCDRGTIRRRFCNICGSGTCAWVDDNVGHDCID